MRFLLGLLFAVIFSTSAFAVPAPYVCLRDWYVATTGSDSGTCGAVGTPCQTPWYVSTFGNLGSSGTGVRAGDCVHVAAGSYDAGGGFNLTTGGNANTSTGYVAWIGAPGQTSRILASTCNYTTSVLAFLTGYAANYNIFDGFEFDGTGVCTGYVISSGNQVHHLQILNSNVHSGTGGIGLSQGDYYVVSGNTIHDNPGTFLSGLSDYEPEAITGFTPTLPADTQTFHIIFTDNTVYNNGLSFTGANTDGNGIQGDDHRYTQFFTAQINTSGTTAAGNNVLHFTSTTGVANGQHINNISNPQVLPTDCIVASFVANTSVTMNHSGGGACNALGTGVATGNTINFGTFPSAGYPYAMLIQGNVVHDNGGAGLRIVWSQNITVSNNSTYHNFLNPNNAGQSRGELASLYSINSTFSNNASYTIPGASGSLLWQSAVSWAGLPSYGMTWANNVTYSSISNSTNATFCTQSVYITGTGADAANCTSYKAANTLHDQNPQWQSLVTPDFHLMSNSPCIGAGTAPPVGYAPVTPDGNLQPNPPNIGAYLQVGGQSCF